MKVSRLLAILILLSLPSCTTPKVETIPPQLPDPEIERKLRSILPAGWSLTAQDNNFTLSRNEKVWLYVQIAWDVGLRNFEEQVKRYGSEQHYEIKLRFEPRMTDAEFEQLKLAREPYEKIVNEGARTKREWGDAMHEFHKRKVPVYVTEKYSVFAEKSDDYPTQVYPDSVLPECKQVLASLDSLFQRYKKSTGQPSDF